MPIQLGLCCINTKLREQKPPVFCSRSCTRKTFSVDKARQLALQNVRDIYTMIEWNEKHHIRCFRLSSDMFPHFTDTTTESYTIDFASEELERAGMLANNYGHRIVMHPGQYNQIGAKDIHVYEQTVHDLEHHANILDVMNIDNNGVLIVHGGGTYGDKNKTIERWMEQFDDLPVKVKKRLVIENCEKGYTAQDCLFISDETGIPVVFDFHHYHCFSLLHPNIVQASISEILPEVIESWGNRKPLMHISEQGTGRIGHHSDFIEEMPPELIEYMTLYPDVHIDVEVEAKMKEQAIFKLYDKYRNYPWLR